VLVPAMLLLVVAPDMFLPGAHPVYERRSFL
jgi:hypothetical protein